jgi:hypothetical protein
MEGDFYEYYINDLYTTHVVMCWVTARPPLAQDLEPSPSMSAQKLRRRRVGQRPAPELLRRHLCHCMFQRRVQCRRQPTGQVTSGSLPCRPTTYVGGHVRRPPASTPMQTWRKFGPGMGRFGCVAPLGRVLVTRRSGRTSLDTRGCDASARWRCPKSCCTLPLPGPNRVVHSPWPS